MIDKTVAGPVVNAQGATVVNQNYELKIGRAFGELDPGDSHNSIITDINLGKDADGKVRYVATFQIVKPKDLSQASGFMWHDVPNRGGRITIVTAEQNLGDIGLSSAWQSDNAGATAVPPLAVANSTSPQTTLGGTGAAGTATSNNEWVIVPVAKNADGSSVTGMLQARIVNRSGPNSAPLLVMGNPVPYLPATLDTKQASLRARYFETVNGQITEAMTIPSSDWAFATCDATHPWPGVAQDLNHADLPGSLPVQVCLKNGFNPNLLYELVYPVKDPYVIGVGHAAFRDLNSFFKNATQDDFGNANPIANAVRWSAIRGVSQSGNFTRAFIHLGFNEDEAGRKVHDGAWPIIAGRRVSLDTRWAQPDGVLELYQMGSEGPQWWGDWPDPVRGLPTTGILHRCNASNTCPKVIEHFGGSEVYALKMTTEWVGTAADQDIPLPDNVRRYYVSSSTHGGGNGSTTQNSAATGVNCPGNNWGAGVFRANPMPETQLTNVLRLAMRNWVMNGTAPPASVWPRISNGTLVDSDSIADQFPKGVPSVPPTIFAPENFTFPVFDYDWGPSFNETDATGVATNMPPPIKSVIKMKVPKVDGDGNELGGVPTVMRDAPLGTYLGWNVTTSGFHQAQVCNYVGGFVPFATTPDQRAGPDMLVRFHYSANLAGGEWSHAQKLDKDPRPSLQERYGNHDGYVAAVTKAANDTVSQGYLLKADADALIAQAQNSDVLNTNKNTSLAAYGEASISEPAGIGPLTAYPKDELQVGYSFNVGKVSASTVTFTRPQVILHATCTDKNGGPAPSSGALNDVNGGPIVVTLPDASYPTNGGQGGWIPANNPHADDSFQLTTTVPDLCQGGQMRIDGNATFTATVGTK